MIEYLEACGLQKSQILMITPPPVCDEKFKAHCRETWGKARLGEGLYTHLKISSQLYTNSKRGSKLNNKGVFLD